MVSVFVLNEGIEMDSREHSHTCRQRMSGSCWSTRSCNALGFFLIRARKELTFHVIAVQPRFGSDVEHRGVVAKCETRGRTPRDSTRGGAKPKAAKRLVMTKA